jgi:ABC-type sugar transport system substrate-binding protein
MTKRWTYLSGLAAAGLATIGLAACGSTASTATSASAAGTNSTDAKTTSGSAAAAAVAPFLAPPTKLLVTRPLKRRPPVEKAVFLSNGIAITQQLDSGAKAAAAALGWQYSTVSVNQNNPATIPSAMLSAINGGAHVVFVSGTAVAVFKPALAVARQKGTVVIDIASGNPPTPGITAFVNNASQDGPEWGKMVGLGILADAAQNAKTANVLLVTAPVFATILGSTDQAAKQTISSRCPSCSVSTLEISPNDLFGGKAPQDVVSYLQTHPSINYILEDSSLTDPGLTEALKAAGMSGTKVFGVAPVQPQIAAVAAGQETGWVIDPLQVMGWMAVDAAARAVTGSDPTLYNAQGMPSYLLTKANASDPTEVPTDYQQQFKEMWHVAATG